MGKCWKKYGYVVLLTFMLSVLWYYGFQKYEEDKFVFYIESAYGQDKVEAIETNGVFNVYLPSYCQLTDVYIDVLTSKEIRIDNKKMEDDISLAWIELEKTYELNIADDAHEIRFWQSANVATLYVTTVNGDMTQVDENQEHQEKVAVAFYKADGTCDNVVPMCRINSRGNATRRYDKKSYLLTLPEEKELLGMNAATKWVLLANATDESNLRNRIVFDMAKQIGLEWSPKCAYIDLYLDGKYHGLYLMAEKVEATDKRLVLDLENGDFLCKIDLSDRWDKLNSPFVTACGRTVEISNAKIVDESDIKRIEKLTNEMEQAIFSEQETDIVEVLDIDSWVRRYLIDEIAGNIDLDVASSYFYYKDNLFFAGPIWDYDMTFGCSERNKNPYELIVGNVEKVSHLQSLYYDALYNNSIFYNRMVEVYEQEFLPLVEWMTEEEIKNLVDRLAIATRLNSIRWHDMFEVNYATEINEMNVEQLIQYLDTRISFLNEIWLENERVELEENGLTYEEMVKNAAKNEVKTTTNIKDNDDTEAFATRDYIAIASIIMLVGMLLCIMGIDVYYRKMERIQTDDI